MFELQKLSIPGAFEILGKVFHDDRGEFRKTVHRGFFEQNGLAWQFAEQFYTSSKKNVIRGMHFQLPPHDHEKMIYCVRGKALDVLLDLRKNSPKFGKSIGIELDEQLARSVYIPRGVAHGFRALTSDAVLMYSVTAVHEPSADTGVRWNSFGFDWGIESPILSARDQALPPLADFQSPF